MSYNGREVIAQIAIANGWAVHDPQTSHGADLVAYERYSTQILIAWTPENTARLVMKNYQCEDEEIAEGPMSLITAREWMESLNV